MQKQMSQRKIIEAYETKDIWKMPHVERERLRDLEEIDLDEPKYNMGVMFFNDDMKTLEIIAYDKNSNQEVGRLLCRTVEDVNAFMSGAFCYFSERK